MQARPLQPQRLPPPLPPCTPLKPQRCCLAQAQESQRSSTGIGNPALSAAAVLSLCRHFTFPFLFQHRCLAQLRHKNLIGLQRAEIFLRSTQLFSGFISADISRFVFASTSLPCTAGMQETQRSSTGIDNPALSTAAVLSLCRYSHFIFASTSLPCTRHRCLADTRISTVFNGRKYSCTQCSCCSFPLPTFHIFFLPQHRCHARLRHKNLIGLQRAEIFLHSAQLLFFTSADIHVSLLPQQRCLAQTQAGTDK